MKRLDYFLQSWRIKQAVRYLRPQDRLLDVGCFDGALLKYAPDPAEYVGIDNQLSPTLHRRVGVTTDFQSGTFPQNLVRKNGQKFDAIVMLAVFEHVAKDDRKVVADGCYDALNPGGRVILSVPDPAVDRILDVLIALKLADGMDLEHHQVVTEDDIAAAFSTPKFKLFERRSFQFGLNRLFVYEKEMA